MVNLSTTDNFIIIINCESNNLLYNFLGYVNFYLHFLTLRYECRGDNSTVYFYYSIIYLCEETLM